jgi:hypothetical protein
VRKLLPTSLALVLAVLLAPMALAQDDDLMVQEGPPLTASPTATATATPTATSGCTTTTDPETGESVTTCIDTAPPTATTGPTPTSTTTPTSTATTDGDGGEGSAILPETGGVSGIALLAGALLVGGGVMSFALVRRS